MSEPPGRNTSLAVPKTRENKAIEHASSSTANLLEGYEHCQPVITVNTFQSNQFLDAYLKWCLNGQTC
ncbi:hypothetical protein NEUTE1DRAFT_38203 [Neurospora tetrasperma FGSC 2508]|uniref:Uncharacterized protein n=1 Tax=Neurospora tetrasperma (strain FGSC 2508 / ATCC MYA-4615 / P0657) TaxID=510951 RepID=F8MJ39_NEUT8|nr:uncharacterized protein NEUTE1DRAFT_38203 [Neurospora tetrasperma FGSC 2508]EGO59088.1 hypothetical protein NEUTE1DRAFT_38203 [Neurospora tetrasperma FGSC 2508]EGZ73192.1 hypothetical protein NEUTE2DRAFT_127544 [Neurospora tetrasperma FGSC 2509]